MSRFGRIGDSIRARLVIGYVLVAAVFALAWGWSLYGPLQDAALHQQQGNLTALAHSSALFATESTTSPELVAKRIASGNDIRVTIVATDGTVLADTENKPSTMANHLDRPEIAAALRGETGSSRRVSATDGVQQLYVAVPATLDGRPVALRVSQSLAEIQSIARTARQVGLGLLLAALAIAIGVATWASGAAARPIRELSHVADRMAQGDLSVQVPAVPSDLQTLARSLRTLQTQMRSRIDALEAEQRTLGTALDGLTDAVFLLDGDLITYANGAAGRLFRAPASGWRGQLIDAAGLPASLSSAVCSRLGAIAPYSAELDPDPLGTTLRLMVAPLESGDSPRSLVVVSDVTERARLERVRRDFVANASHELKTPVAGIQLLAESAGTAAEDGDTIQAMLFTQQIESEASRLKRLVSDLLDLSRLESAPAPDAVTDIRQAVDNAFLAHRSAAARRGLELDLDVSRVRGLDVYVSAEPTDIAVALDNLLDNAIAYTESGRVQLTVRASETAVKLDVADTGVGIAPEHLARIFERFYRVDRARSRESGGTGLGLALVRHVVERSGGSVAVASEPGVGTTFSVSLPRAV